MSGMSGQSPPVDPRQQRGNAPGDEPTEPMVPTPAQGWPALPPQPGELALPAPHPGELLLPPGRPEELALPPATGMYLLPPAGTGSSPAQTGSTASSPA